MTVGVLGVEEPEEASELAGAELLASWLEELEEPPATPICFWGFFRHVTSSFFINYCDNQ